MRAEERLRLQKHLECKRADSLPAKGCLEEEEKFTWRNRMQAESLNMGAEESICLQKPLLFIKKDHESPPVEQPLKSCGTSNLFASVNHYDYYQGKGLNLVVWMYISGLIILTYIMETVKKLDFLIVEILYVFKHQKMLEWIIETLYQLDRRKKRRLFKMHSTARDCSSRDDDLCLTFLCVNGAAIIVQRNNSLELQRKIHLNYGYDIFIDTIKNISHLVSIFSLVSFFAANEMSCGPSCQGQIRSPSDTKISKRDHMKPNKKWFESEVRKLSKCVLQVSGKTKYHFWTEDCKPEWWDKEVGQAWKNPTANPKDKKEDLKKKYLALKKYLISIKKFPEELNEETGGKEEIRSLNNKLEQIKFLAENFVLSNSSKISLIIDDKIFTLIDVENSIDMESLGHKRINNADDDSVPSKMCKSKFFHQVPNHKASPQEQRLFTSIDVRNTPQGCTSTLLIPDGNNYLTVPILDCPNNKMSFKDTQKDFNFRPAVDTFNFNPQITNTVTTDDVSMTPALHAYPDTPVLNKTTSALNISSSESMCLSSTSLKLQSDMSFSSGFQEFIPLSGSVTPALPFPAGSNTPALPSREENVPPVIPTITDHISLKTSSSVSLDTSDSRKPAPPLDYLCPELIEYTSSYLPIESSVAERSMESPHQFDYSDIFQSLPDFDSPPSVSPLDETTDLTYQWGQHMTNIDIDNFCQEDDFDEII